VNEFLRTVIDNNENQNIRNEMPNLASKSLHRLRQMSSAGLGVKLTVKNGDLVII